MWRATQLLSLYRLLDRPGPIAAKDDIPLGANAKWGVDDPIGAAEQREVLEKLAKLLGRSSAAGMRTEQPLKAGEFAIMVAKRLQREAQ